MCEDGHIVISKDSDTIIEYEREQFNNNQDFICIYTDRAIQDLKAWVASNGLPDFSSEPTHLSNIRYVERDPGVGELTIECVVNDFRKISLCIDLEKMSVVDNVFDEIPAILVRECADYGGDVKVLKKHNEIDREISRQLNEFIQSHLYHPADDMLSYRMEYGVFYYDHDFSQIIRYDVPVVVDGKSGRLVVNRKDSLWEACLYISDNNWSKFQQSESSRMGAFSHMNDTDFLNRVRDLCILSGGGDFKILPDRLAA